YCGRADHSGGSCADGNSGRKDGEIDGAIFSSAGAGTVEAVSGAASGLETDSSPEYSGGCKNGGGTRSQDISSNLKQDCGGTSRPADPGSGVCEQQQRDTFCDSLRETVL